MNHSEPDKSRIKSDLDKLVELFKYDKKLITATKVREAGIARDKDSQYRRDLLKLAFDMGYAKKTNGATSAHKKYGVCFNTDEEILREYFFDWDMLLSPVIINLPPREYHKRNLSIEQHAEWNNQKCEWIATYQFFCIWQCPETPYTPIQLGDPDQKRYLIGSSIRYARMYRAIKLGWSEVEKILPQRPDIPRNYNRYFLDYLINTSILDFEFYLRQGEESIKWSSLYTNRLAIRKASNEGIYNPQQYFEDGRIDEKISLKKALNFFDKERDLVYKYIKKVHTLNGVIKLCLKKSEDTQVKKALDDWLEADAELENICISLTRQW
jgi:hypothetical protein